MFTTAKNLVMKNCTLTDCAATGSGGMAQGGSVFHNIVNKSLGDALKTGDDDYSYSTLGEYYSIGTSTTLENCHFTNCYDNSWAGGSVETDAQHTVIRGCSFKDAYTMGDSGGALIVYTHDTADSKLGGSLVDSSLTISDTTFENCHCDGNRANTGGGAIRTTTMDTTLTNCTFTNATTVKTGGAVVVSNGSAESLTILGCAFKDCVAGTTGGAIDSLAIKLTIDDYTAADGTVTHTTFENCTASGNGGGIRHERNVAESAAVLNGCSFKNCVSTNGAGGGLYTNNIRELRITGIPEVTTFDNCKAAGHGGGVRQDSNGTIGELVNCTFDSCTSGNNGGGAYMAAAQLIADNSGVKSCVAVNNGGGFYLNAGGTGTTVTNGSFDNNTVTSTTGSGGSLYINNNNATISGSTIKNSIAANGGGIYKNGGNLYLKETTISNCKATISGGGLRSGATLYLQDNTQISDCYAAASGGGVYNGTTTIEGGSKITGCYAPQGGGFYSTNQLTIITGGDVITNCHARNVSIAEDGTVTLAEAATAGNEGGGIYKSSSDLLMEDRGGASNIKGCTAYDGGGIYSNATISLRYGDVSGNSASHDGGGIYMNAGTLNLTTGAANNNATISGNTAGNNGGGVYHAAGTLNMYNKGSITGNTAQNNGGGVYHAAGNFTMKNTATIAGNEAENNGGGVYHGGGAFTMSGGVIGGAEGKGNAADIGGGVYVADGQTLTMNEGTNSAITYNAAATEGGGIAVGTGSMLNFVSYVTVRHNTLRIGEKNVENNIHLNQDSNAVIRQTGHLTAASYIGVYCADDQDPTHGYSGMPFGTYTSNNTNCINRFFNDRRPYLYGVKGTANSQIIWATFVCKITDSEGNMLYKDTEGTPALYEKLENNDNNYNGNTTSAFGILTYSDHRLYTAGGVKYEGAYKIQMYVQEYTAKWRTEVKNSKTITLTTASAEPDECKLRYDGDLKHPYATIIRDANYGRMFQLNDNLGCTLNLTDIVLDGGSENGYKANQEGGILYIGPKDAVVMGANVTLRNSNSNDKAGAAVYINAADASLTMNDGAVITNCVTTGNGGGVCVNNGTFTMNGGTIAECSANNGGGVYLVDRTTVKLVMNGGAITGCNAKTTGGAVVTAGANARINFSGNPVVMGNTLNGTTACNVHLNYDNNLIINASGLAADAEIGIYTTGLETNTGSVYYKHGREGTPFGTWLQPWTDADNPQCFVNDRNDELRGSRGAQGSQLIYWAQNYRLEIDAKVVSDLTADYDKTFSYTVAIASENVKKKTFSDIKFDAEGRGVVNLKHGQTLTFYFPEELKFADYNVTLTDADPDKYKYTTAVQKDEDEPADESAISGRLGENLSDETPSGLSVVTFTHKRVTGDLKIGKTVVGADAGDAGFPLPRQVAPEPRREKSRC